MDAIDKIREYTILALDLSLNNNVSRYNEMLFMVETCEAATVIQKIAAPGIVATASSIRG